MESVTSDLICHKLYVHQARKSNPRGMFSSLDAFNNFVRMRKIANRCLGPPRGVCQLDQRILGDEAAHVTWAVPGRLRELLQRVQRQ